MNGRVTVHEDDPLLAELAGAQLVVRVRAEAISSNWLSQLMPALAAADIGQAARAANR